MSDDYDDENFGSDDEYGEGGIPADLEADIEERINRAADDRLHDLHTDSGPAPAAASSSSPSPSSACGS